MPIHYSIERMRRNLLMKNLLFKEKQILKAVHGGKRIYFHPPAGAPLLRNKVNFFYRISM